MEALSTELPILKGQIEKSEDRFSRFKNETGSVNLSEQANVVIRQLADVQAKMTDLKVQRQELLRRFTKDDSTVLAVDRQITTLSARATQLEAEARMLPELEQQALRLSRDISVNNQLYAGLLSNMQQLRFIKAGRVNEVRLIDDATLPEEPIKPRRWLIVALGILGGAFLGILLALAKKAWSGKIDGPDDIERRTGLPVFVSGAFGDVSRAASYRQGIDGVHARESSQCPDSRLPSGESLRRFSAIFEHKMHESGARIALFSGVNAWTGTSFVAEQVAAQLAQNGARVLLIDADARAGRLSKRRNAGAAPGLSDVISGRSTFEEVIAQRSAKGRGARQLIKGYTRKVTDVCWRSLSVRDPGRCACAKRGGNARHGATGRMCIRRRAVESYEARRSYSVRRRVRINRRSGDWGRAQYSRSQEALPLGSRLGSWRRSVAHCLEYAWLVERVWRNFADNAT
jgi:tyrosine-protein kinase Etk/Wzc